MVSDFKWNQGRIRIRSKLIPWWSLIIPVSIESIKIDFENCFEMVETDHIPDSKTYHLTQIPNGWIFNPLMRHSMLSDFEGKQGHMSTGSKLIPVWCWITLVSIESIRIGFIIGNYTIGKWGYELGYFHDFSSMPLADVTSFEVYKPEGSYVKFPHSVNGFPSEHSRMTGLSFRINIPLNEKQVRVKKRKKSP